MSRRLILPTANKLFKRHFVAASDSGNVHKLPDLGYDYSARMRMRSLKITFMDWPLYV
jgi:hypothetical protein